MIDIIIFNGFSFRFKVLFPLNTVNFVNCAPFIPERPTRRNYDSSCSIMSYETKKD